MECAMVEHGEVARDYEGEGIARHRSAIGPPFHARDSEHFTASGGKLMENIIFRAIIDSLHSMNVVMPPLPSDGDECTNRTRYRARWSAGKTVQRTMEARQWAETMAPLYWPVVCSYRYQPILDWLKEKWYEVDVHPDRARSLRSLVSDCLVEGYLNG